MSEKGKLIYTGGNWELAREKRSRRARVIDAHTHIFPRLGTQRQGIDPALRVMFWQFHSREFNNWWRVEDGAHVDRQFLQFDSNDLADMPDVGFRLTDYGKARITVEGVDYEMQVSTPSVVNNELPPERMVGEMNMAGVDLGVLQSDHVYGDLSEYFGQAMRDYPGRFIGLAQIWEPEADDDARLDLLREAITTHGNRGLYFSVEPFSVLQMERSLNDPQLDRLWELLKTLEVPVFWFLDDRTFNRVEMFMRRVIELKKWAQRHPEIDSVITHGLVPAAIIHEIGIPEEVMDVLGCPNVFAEILFPAKFPDYPFPEGQLMLQRLRDRVGAEKLMWGSDSPYGMTMWCTYRQSIDFIRVHCDFLSADEMDQILGVNAARMFGVEPYNQD